MLLAAVLALQPAMAAMAVRRGALRADAQRSEDAGQGPAPAADGRRRPQLRRDALVHAARRQPHRGAARVPGRREIGERSSTARSAASSRSRPSCSRIARPPTDQRSWPRSNAPTGSSGGWRPTHTCASGAGRRWLRRWMRMSAPPASRWPAPTLAWPSRASTCTARWTAAAGHPGRAGGPAGRQHPSRPTTALRRAEGIITDTHFSERGRQPPGRVRGQGRHLAGRPLVRAGRGRGRGGRGRRRRTARIYATAPGAGATVVRAASPNARPRTRR